LQLIRGRRHYVAEERIKNYMYQLMKSMDHMHRNGIFHRDIKVNDQSGKSGRGSMNIFDSSFLSTDDFDSKAASPFYSLS
jgi:serine/threonine protein kinase